jgi:hypothetical protein
MTILSAFERLDLLVPLIAGHLLADFVFQTSRMVAHKDRWDVLLGHVSVVAIASWALVGHGLGAVPLILLVSLLHLLIDMGKAAVERWAFRDERKTIPDVTAARFWSQNGRLVLFLGDQALHVLSLILAVAVLDRVPFVAPPAPDTGIWTAAFGASYLRLLVLVSGWVVATTAAGYFFAFFLARFETQLEDDQKGGLQKGGYWIGVTERSVIYLFILVGEPTGIGFLAAAKSVFRIGELRESKDRKLAEYILIGTLVSFAAAMVVGLATRAVLSAMP